MIYPLPIDETIGTCVANVQAKLLTELQAANPKADIRGINYMFGHPQELFNMLVSMGNGTASRYSKYPVVMLFADVPSSTSAVKGSFGDVTLNMVIAMSTQADKTASWRINTNFKPILRPIYNELLQAIWRSGYFHLQTPKSLLPFGTERLYWGVTGVSGNTANKTPEFLDAIEIKGMRLTPTTKGTASVANVPKMWHTVILNIVANPDPTKLIYVGGGKYIQQEYAPGPTITPKLIGDATGYLAVRMIEMPWFYSDEPNSLVDFDNATGTWSEAANGNFSAGAYLTIKFLGDA